MLIIDKLCYYSKLRYVNPMEKFLYSIITIIFLIASRSMIMAVGILFLNYYLNVVKGGLSPKRYKMLLSWPLSFLFLGTFALFVNISKMPLDLYAFPVGTYYITGSKIGMWQGCQLIVTALAAVSSLYFLSLNTTMPDIISVLRKCKLPRIFVELMMLIYRFIFILLGVAMNITISQKARLGYKDYKTSIKSFGYMLSALFINSMKRSSQLYDAMEARGYDGELRMIEEHYKQNTKTMYLIVFFGVGLCIATIWIRIEGIVFI
ncbi:cobalt ECF transporter T component CbiQ [Eubacteriales bacterium KG127]